MVELPIIEQRIAEAKTKYKGIGIDLEDITCTVDEFIAWAQASGYSLEYASSIDGYLLKW